MPALAGRTREQLRVSVGRNLGAVFVGTTTSTASDATSVLDTSLRGGDNQHNGKYVVATSGTNDGEKSRANDYAASTNDITVSPAFGATVPSGMTYELWNEPYDPVEIEEFLNEAILDATGRVYDPEESVALFADGKQARFDLPSEFNMVNKIQYRHKVSSTRIHDCGSTFDEVSTPTGFTQSLDTKDKKQGAQSLKISFAAGASAGAFIADSITATDISAYDTIEMWVKVTGIGSALVAGNLKLHLDDGTVTADGNDKESLDLPAISPDTWTFARMSLANPESDTAIASVGLEHDADLGAGVTVWIDDISAVANDTAVWSLAPHTLWSIDKESQDLVLTETGRKSIGYSLLKLTGGSNPSIMTADSDVCEVDNWFVICRATELALASHSKGSSTDPDDHDQRSVVWAGRAELARRRMPILQNVRAVG